MTNGETWQERLILEEKELKEKINKLEAYINRHIDDQSVKNYYLCKQLYYMESYLNILNIRHKEMLLPIGGGEVPKAFRSQIYTSDKNTIKENGVLKVSYGDLIVKSINGKLTIVIGVAI